MLDHEKVRNLRSDLGISQAELARATGINRTVLSGFETGQLALKGDCERRLLDFFEHQGIELDRKKAAKALPKPQAVQKQPASAVAAPQPDKRLLAEYNWLEARIRELEGASCRKGFIDSFMERDKEEREELAILQARWRVLVLALQGRASAALPASDDATTHSDVLAIAYRELREKTQ